MSSKLSVPDVQAKLQVSPDMLSALLYSGLLGWWDTGGVSESAVNDYLRYGTQWDATLGPRTLGENPYQNPPLIPGESEQQPPGSVMRFRIRPSNRNVIEDNDNAWIVHAYLRPNPFFFQVPTNLALIGPLPLQLENARLIAGAPLPTTLYPGPDGKLALVAVACGSGPSKKAEEAAMDSYGPILDELAVRYDQPLPIAQTAVIGIPSAIITVTTRSQVPLKSIGADTAVLAGPRHEELRIPYALYREAVSSNDPFHQFIAFWRCYEATRKIKGDWNGRYRISAPTLHAETLPRVFAFSTSAGKGFNTIYQELNRPFRVAVAHGTLDRPGENPKTSAYSKDYVAVSVHVPLIRYMARISLLNLDHCLDNYPLRDSSVL
jgi:hypothetical protein